MAGRASSQRTRKENANFIHQSILLEGCKPLQDILDISEIPFGGLRNVVVFFYFNLNSYGKRAFSVAAPELWNNLPEDIKSANSIDDFKRKLKTFLFMRAYES